MGPLLGLVMGPLVLIKKVSEKTILMVDRDKSLSCLKITRIEVTMVNVY